MCLSLSIAARLDAGRDRVVVGKGQGRVDGDETRGCHAGGGHAVERGRIVERAKVVPEAVEMEGKKQISIRSR